MLRISLLSPCFREKNTSLLPSAERRGSGAVGGSQQSCFMRLDTAASFPFALVLCLLVPPFQFPSPGWGWGWGAGGGGAAKHRPLPRSPCRHQQLPGNSDNHANRRQNSCGDQREPLLPESTRRKGREANSSFYQWPFISVHTVLPNPQPSIPIIIW